MKREVKLLIWSSIIANAILFGMKYFAGIMDNSVAIIADAWHSLSDTMTSVIVLVGFKVAAMPPDKEHPFGHGRAESIAALMVGSILGMVGLNFAIESGMRLASAETTHYGAYSAYIIGFSIIIKEVLAQITIRMGKSLNSQSLIADGWHHRTDSISSAIILVGLIFGGIGWWFDGVAGLGVSFMILYAAYEIIKDTIDGLLGETPDANMLHEIIDISNAVDNRISSIHNLKLHSYGDHKELNLDIRLPESMTVVEAHNIADMLEHKIYEQYGMKATVHIEPGIIVS